MIIGLFAFIFVLAAALVVVGLVKRNISGSALIGFSLIFILSQIVIAGNLEYSTAVNTTTTFTYDVNGSVSSTDQRIVYDYIPWNDDTSQQVGYWLAIASAISFIIMLYQIRATRKNEE